MIRSKVIVYLVSRPAEAPLKEDGTYDREEDNGGSGDDDDEGMDDGVRIPLQFILVTYAKGPE